MERRRFKRIGPIPLDIVFLQCFRSAEADRVKSRMVPEDTTFDVAGNDFTLWYFGRYAFVLCGDYGHPVPPFSLTPTNK